MMRVCAVLAITLTVLVLPMTGVAGDSGAVTQQQQAGSKPDTKSLPQGETVKKSDQRDVQSRGLFSKKKKKKKPVGGAAGHSPSQEQTDLPPQEGLGGGSR